MFGILSFNSVRTSRQYLNVGRSSGLKLQHFIIREYLKITLNHYIYDIYAYINIILNAFKTYMSGEAATGLVSLPPPLT